jgi:hypothetical protein
MAHVRAAGGPAWMRDVEQRLVQLTFQLPQCPQLQADNPRRGVGTPPVKFIHPRREPQHQQPAQGPPGRVHQASEELIHSMPPFVIVLPRPIVAIQSSMIKSPNENILARNRAGVKGGRSGIAEATRKQEFKRLVSQKSEGERARVSQRARVNARARVSKKLMSLLALTLCSLRNDLLAPPHNVIASGHSHNCRGSTRSSSHKTSSRLRRGSFFFS